jgi:hypothetical protein
MNEQLQKYVTMRRARSGVLFVLVSMLVACRDEHVVSPAVNQSAAAAPRSVGVTQRTPKYLKYGVAVPDTGSITAEPEPYDPRRHGPTLKDTRPKDNVANEPGKELPRRKLGPGFAAAGAVAQTMGAPAPSTAFNDSWRGYNILEGRGIYARFDLPDPPQVTAPNPPSDWIAYTPTAIPGGYSCLELTGVHFKDHNQWGTPYNDAFGIWDWCNQMKFVYSANTTNYSFRDPYTRFYTDEQGQSRRAYWVQAFAHTPTSRLLGSGYLQLQ